MQLHVFNITRVTLVFEAPQSAMRSSTLKPMGESISSKFLREIFAPASRPTGQSYIITSKYRHLIKLTLS